MQDVLYIGADEYETDAERAGILANGGVPIGIGENTVIRNAIIDKNARIGKNCVITNKDVSARVTWKKLCIYGRSFSRLSVPKPVTIGRGKASAFFGIRMRWHVDPMPEVCGIFGTAVRSPSACAEKQCTIVRLVSAWLGQLQPRPCVI